MANVFGFWRRAPRSAKWVMGISLALNLFVVGLIVGGSAAGRWGGHGPYYGAGPPHGRRGPPPHGFRRDPIRATLRDLPEARRDSLDGALREDHAARRAVQGRICASGAALKDLWDAGAPPSPEDFSAKTQDLQEAWTAAAQLRTQTTMRFYEALTPEERAVAAQQFRRIAERAARRCAPHRR